MAIARIKDRPAVDDPNPSLRVPVDGESVAIGSSTIDQIVRSPMKAAAAKNTPVDGDYVPVIDSEDNNLFKQWSMSAIKSWFRLALGAIITGATAKSTPVDDDEFVLSDSAASGATKKTSLANLKAVLQTTVTVPDDIDATGTPSNVTYLRGDGTWAVPVGSGGGGGGGTVDAIVEGAGIEVTDTDPANPVVALTSAVQISLGKADSALQGSDIGNSVQAHDANTLKSDESLNLTAGYTSTADNDGTVTTGTYKPDPAGGNLKRYINGGAHTFAAPDASNDYTLIVQITNNGSAGAITFSGFTLAPTGAALTTTNGHKFRVYIEKIDGVVTGYKRALQ